MNNATFKSYFLGFVLSAALTLTAFIAVIRHLLPASNLIFVIMGLALIQLWVQLVFFLHLDYEKGPRWNLAIFISTIGIILIVVVGTLWIMKNLNYNMTPAQVDKYIQDQAGGF
ncbi:MAG: cytochrome o ubiquinol oxidase subunit IV [Candidatus Doudnabacteria bacterium]